MITLINISIQYGGRFLFDDISFSIGDRDRIGLVGKNGAGKTTLLKVLTRQIIPESGSIQMDNLTTIGYLPQTLQLAPTDTVYEETAKAFDELKKMQNQQDELVAQIAAFEDFESPQYQQLLTRLNDLQEQLQHLGSGNLREGIERVLKGLGFVSSDLDRPLSEFSGGWQMRVELAKILLRRPSYILLDEPTNHLDIEAIMWLENYLRNYAGGVLVISHDRAFLDQVTSRTVELVGGKMYDYRTSYSQFIELRQKRIEKQKADARRQEEYVEHTQELINKFRAKKNKAAFAQTLIRKLDKLEKVEIDELETSAIQFRFPEAPRSGKVVVEIEHLNKSYGAKEVLKNINFTLERGEKVAFVGKNGEGKTTLTKIITNKTDYTGNCQIGYNVSIGYYEQHQAEALDGSQTVFQTIDDVATGDMRLRVRALLGAFLFSGEDADKKVSVLSGGEKSRLALAKLLLQPTNLLILDEPTNHLDMQAKEVLKNAIKAFEGTLIVVSHDREFLQGLTDKVYEFGNKSIIPHMGDIYSFLEQRRLNSLDELNLGLRKTATTLPNTSNSENLSEAELRQLRTTQHEHKKNLEKNIRQLNNRIKKTEQAITDLETTIAQFEHLMQQDSFYADPQQSQNIIAQYGQAKQQLEAEMENWTTAATELEEQQAERDKLS